MFAARVAKIKAKAPTNSNHRSPYLPPAVQPTRRQDSEPSGHTVRETAPPVSWDFSAIPIFPSGRARQTEPSAPCRVPSLPGMLQAKLAIGSVNDPFEHEADRVADQVMHIPASSLAVTAASQQLSRICAACENEEKTLQRKLAGPHDAVTALDLVHDVLRSPGQPLDAATRAYFEPRFGHDFSQVRVHSGLEAEQSARVMNAHAYTVGHDIVFGADRFAPATREGRRLIAHELTHVVQQQNSHLQPFIQRVPANFCKPFSPREIDEGLDVEIGFAMDYFVHGDLRDFFGDEVADLYDKYLTSTEKNVTPTIFDDPKSRLVQSFINHDATNERQHKMAAIIEKTLPIALLAQRVRRSSDCGFLPANKWVDAHFLAYVPPEELNKGFSFGGIVPTIPGIVAGGISSGPGSIDSRTASFKQVLLRRSEVGGRTTGLRLRVQFHFVVKDAIDFCPGNPGNALQQIITIPLSRLEASKLAFSVPFEVHYDGPVLEVDLGPQVIDACK
jgi:hypothetical protein